MLYFLGPSSLSRESLEGKETSGTGQQLSDKELWQKERASIAEMQTVFRIAD
jgi:hypothetical protein